MPLYMFLNKRKKKSFLKIINFFLQIAWFVMNYTRQDETTFDYGKVNEKKNHLDIGTK